MPLFVEANEAAVKSAAENLEWVAANYSGASDEAAPTSTADGIALQGTSRCLVALKPDDPTDVTVTIWLYYPDLVGWYKVNGGSFTVTSADDGWVERFDCAGASRIFAQLTDFSGTPTTTDRDYGRAILPST